MNQLTFHLIVFLATLAAVVTIILTGHDSSPLVTNLLAGAIGGSGGAGVGTLLFNFFKGPQDPTVAAPVTKQAGYTHLRFIALLLPSAFIGALVACASVNTVTPQQTVATACATASAAVKSLTVVEQAGALTVSDVQNVNNALAVVNTICEAPTEPTYTQATVDALTGATAQLVQLQTKYHATAAGS